MYSIDAQQGAVWAGFDGSVAKFEESNGTWVPYFPPGLITRITCIVIRKDEVWFGSFGNGIFRYANGQWTVYTKEDGLADNRVKDLAVHDGYLYAATAAGASRLPLSGNAKFQSIRMTNGLPDEGLSSVCVLNDRVWFGSKAHGVLGLTVSDFSYKEKVSIEEGLPDSTVLSLDSDGQYLWIGTGSGGLCRYNPADGTIAVYNKSSGLADNLVGSVAADSVVWCGSWGSGATAVAADGTATVYDRSDGLADNDIRDISIDSGAVWFATAGGVTRFGGKVGGGGALSPIYVAIGIGIVLAFVIPLAMKGRSQVEQSRSVRKKMPYELCNGRPAENLCPFCKYNVIRSGRHYCSKYNVRIPFE